MVAIQCVLVGELPVTRYTAELGVMQSGIEKVGIHRFLITKFTGAGHAIEFREPFGSVISLPLGDRGSLI